MIKTFKVQSFKSLDHVEIELGQVNVFIGANGSGKSNLLEAIGVLSAAADGRVDDQRLLMRGVRPGVPALYKSSFRKPQAGKSEDTRQPPHLLLAASSESASYEVTLHNPLNDPLPAWRFKTEMASEHGARIFGRSPSSKEKPNTEAGLAALKAVELPVASPALRLLKAMQQYVIYTPTTSVMRGIAPETQPRKPVGLSGGNLPDAVLSLLRDRKSSAGVKRVARESLELIDWASSFGAASATSLPLSPAAAASPMVTKFVDRFMNEKRNVLSGYDASEGALYVLFLGVLAAHRNSPAFCAVDNADHGLNPRLARTLMLRLCGWYLEEFQDRQILLTTHNPPVLDGLPLQDDRVRLFTVSRDETGRTVVHRVNVSEQLLKASRNGTVPLSRLWVMGHLGGVPDV